MMPTTLAGSQIGAFMLVTFPPLYLQVALLITLILLGLQSTKKAIEITRKENQQDQALEQPLLDSQEGSDFSLQTNMIDQFSEKNYSSREMSPSTGRGSPHSNGKFEK